MTDTNVYLTAIVKHDNVMLDDGAAIINFPLPSKDTVEVLGNLHIPSEPGVYTVKISDDAYDKALRR